MLRGALRCRCLWEGIVVGIDIVSGLYTAHCRWGNGGFRGVFPCLSCHRPQKDSQATCIVEVETLLLRNLLYPHPGGAEDGAREGEGEGEGEPDSSHIHVARQ